MARTRIADAAAAAAARDRLAALLRLPPGSLGPDAMAEVLALTFALGDWERDRDTTADAPPDGPPDGPAMVHGTIDGADKTKP